MKTYTHFIWFFVLLFFSCKIRYDVASSTANQYKVAHTASDTLSAIEAFLKPYKDSLDKNMNEVIGYAEGDFIKEKPSGSLGNVVADAMRWKAALVIHKFIPNVFSENRVSSTNVLFAITNFGGIRINEIKKGDIKLGKVFELLPFENELVILELKGDLLKKWCELIAKSGGWPIADLRFTSKNEEVDDLRTKPNLPGITDYSAELNKKRLADDSYNTKIVDSNTYYIATNDYVANGGDNCDFLKTSKQYKTGILIRDLMIDFIKYKRELIPDAVERIKLLNK